MNDDDGERIDGRRGGLSRRQFLRTGAAMAGAAAMSRRGSAEPGTVRPDFERWIPADKKLPPDWVKSLFDRGEGAFVRWPESRWIGLPVGGLCAGQVYLGGDGRLWLWDIFNRIENSGSGGPHYVRPLEPDQPLAQGFALRIEPRGSAPQIRRLDHTGWAGIQFRGDYPVGVVRYQDPDCPVVVELEAFSPFCPLDAADSALPATIMAFTVRNISNVPAKVEAAGWLENAVLKDSGWPEAVRRRNRIVNAGGHRALVCEAIVRETAAEKRPDILFEDFEKETYEGWEVSGRAFGDGPARADRVPAYQGDPLLRGARWVNSHTSAPGASIAEKDDATGRLLSRPFVIERNFISLLVGGGNRKGQAGVKVLVDGAVVAQLTGANANAMTVRSLDVRKWMGRTARLEIFDEAKGGWGNIGVDHIVFTDEGGSGVPLAEERDMGSMALALMAGGTGEVGACAGLPESDDPAAASLAARGAGAAELAEQPLGRPLIGALARSAELQPGTSAEFTFVVAWHCPNLLGLLGPRRRRHYAGRFADAAAVAAHVAANVVRFARQTRLWRDTWYDSSLPRWFLDRTMATTAHLATNTCYWFDDGRFYAWEGVGCCGGTCTHVWHYAQGVARLFPELERSLRRHVDFGVAFDAATGKIGFRGELHKNPAIDGQAGVILRSLREHQMSPDGGFLREFWPRIRKALEYLIDRDGNDDGIIEGAQHNTLDADWYGRSSWLCGMYLAALRAGEEMAREMSDDAVAARCRAIFERGRRIVDTELFNGEYYIHEPDPGHRAIGSYDGCHIDQVLGQGWAWQVGLGRIHDAEQTRKALASLWRYNFAPDVGPFRAAHPAGRWYAVAGEAGMIMCAWPRGEAQRVRSGPDMYFNECMTGFEHQAAGHMIAEGMVLEGLAVTRAIHDRYHPARRNPWNEIECGDHYGRALASYGTYLAACGFECHGPKRHIGFAPRLAPEAFKAAFTSAEGWGVFEQKREGGRLTASLSVRWGRLRLRTIALEVERAPRTVSVSVNGARATVQHSVDGTRLLIVLPAETTMEAGQGLAITVD